MQNLAKIMEILQFGCLCVSKGNETLFPGKTFFFIQFLLHALLCIISFERGNWDNKKKEMFDIAAGRSRNISYLVSGPRQDQVYKCHQPVNPSVKHRVEITVVLVAAVVVDHHRVAVKVYHVMKTFPFLNDSSKDGRMQ